VSTLAARSPLPVWESAGEREEKIAKARRARYKDLRPPKRLTPELLADIEAARLISRPGLAQLVARDYSQPVVSLYLNMAPDEVVGSPTARLKLFNSMRHGELASRAYLIDQLTAADRARLTRDLDELEELVRTEDAEGSRSLVAFKSGSELNEAIRPAVKTADRVSIDVDPYVSPIESALELHPPTLLVEVRKEETHFWVYRLGRLKRIRSLNDFVPSDTVDDSRPGKAQRHRQTHLIWHLKATAKALIKFVEDSDLELLVLAGDDSVLAELEQYLHVTITQKVVGRLPPSPGVDIGDWQRQVEAVLLEHRRRREVEALGHLGDYQAAGLLFGGMGPALEIVNRLLARRLFVSADLRREGFLCRQHHFLSLEAGECPFCGRELFPTENIVDEMVEVARFHKTGLTTVTAVPERLEGYEGVAAVTYYRVDPASLPALSSAAR
jgi:hypothetical protein